jgi:hypothetical protein
MTTNEPLPVPPGWRKVVKDTIERLEKRAAQGELFATLALDGWKDERDRLKEVEPTQDGEQLSQLS